MSTPAATVAHDSHGAGPRIYSSLQGATNKIRLVYILPNSNFTDPISCTLLPVPVDQCPPYEALSYTWGDPNVTEHIILSGYDFNATTNLVSSLRYLRYGDKPRLMWIDAICINQTDNRERIHQVRQMRRIYQGASQVVVWLGSVEHSPAKRAFSCIRTLGRSESLHWDLKLQPNLEKEHLNIGDFLALVWVLRLPWWGRVWTVQEVLLAKSLIFVYGNECCSGETIFAITRSFFQHTGSCCIKFSDSYQTGVDLDGELNRVFTEVGDIARFRNTSTIQLESILARFRHRISTEPHDKMYGFLGLAEDFDEGLIDYNKPFSTAFEDMTLQIILKSGDLNVFSQIFGKDRHVITHPEYVPDDSYKLPSWCPDWNLLIKYWTLKELNNRLDVLFVFNACDGESVDGFVQDAGTMTSDGRSLPFRILALSGLPVDVIKTVGDICWSSRGQQHDIYRQWRQVMESSERSQGKYISGQSWHEAFWHTLCGGIGSYSEKDGSPLVYPAFAFDRSLFDTWWRDEIRPQDGEKLPRPAKTWTENWVQSFNFQVGVAAVNRRYFISENGFMGLAPAETREGDVICIFKGGRVPFVLRPNADIAFNYDGDISLGYKFLGDSYVQGVMNGEVIKALENRRNSWQYYFLA